MSTGTPPYLGLVKAAALSLLVLMPFAVPGAYLYFGYGRLSAEVAGEVNYKAQQISQLIAGNPEYWRFEGVRIGELIKAGADDADRKSQRVVDIEGDIVVQLPPQEPVFRWPTMIRERPLLDYGRTVGRLQVTHSLEQLYRRAGLIGIVSLILALLLYWILKVVPLRLLNNAWDRISYLASHDALTGLPNRLTFVDRLDRALSRAKRTDATIAVYSIDLDRFKEVNDILGHAAGDLLLKSAAMRMHRCLRQDDTLARFGGDEFALFQTEVDEPANAAATAERIISALSEPFNLNGNDATIGASVGIAIHAGTAFIDSADLLKNADLALYKSKNDGRGIYRFFHEKMDAELRARKTMEFELRNALHSDGFELHYQPLVDMASQRIKGMEALLRWPHPQLGNIPPANFIPVAETTGLIRPLTDWVLRTACQDAMNWAPISVAVNLSPILFQQGGLVAMVEAALRESGLPAERLELEITEGILITETERTLEVLKELKARGVRIAMDDFGTGYSSLSYLRRFPFDKIKIDRSFVSGLDQSPDAQAIVRAIIGMSQALKMRINAEGVETIEQAIILQSAGCEEVQGYLYGRPMCKKDIETLLSSTQATALSPPHAKAV